MLMDRVGGSRAKTKKRLNSYLVHQSVACLGPACTRLVFHVQSRWSGGSESSWAEGLFELAGAQTWLATAVLGAMGSKTVGVLLCCRMVPSR